MKTRSQKKKQLVNEKILKAKQKVAKYKSDKIEKKLKKKKSNHQLKKALKEKIEELDDLLEDILDSTSDSESEDTFEKDNNHEFVVSDKIIIDEDDDILHLSDYEDDDGNDSDFVDTQEFNAQDLKKMVNVVRHNNNKNRHSNKIISPQNHHNKSNDTIINWIELTLGNTDEKTKENELSFYEIERFKKFVQFCKTSENVLEWKNNPFYIELFETNIYPVLQAGKVTHNENLSKCFQNLINNKAWISNDYQPFEKICDICKIKKNRQFILKEQRFPESKDKSDVVKHSVCKRCGSRAFWLEKIFNILIAGNVLKNNQSILLAMFLKLSDYLQKLLSTM